MFTSPNLARVLGGKNIISKQLAITMFEKAGKQLNRNYTGTAKDGQALQAFYGNGKPDPCTC